MSGIYATPDSRPATFRRGAAGLVGAGSAVVAVRADGGGVRPVGRMTKIINGVDNLA